jgi:hypothetical protein
MKNKSSTKNNNNLVKLHSQKFLENQRVAGKVVANTLSLLKSLIDKEKTLLELNKIAEEFIQDNKCFPTFKNYKSKTDIYTQSTKKALPLQQSIKICNRLHATIKSCFTIYFSPFYFLGVAVRVSEYPHHYT